MSAADHNKILDRAAKSALTPIGCFRKGRSRLWLDDHGWWIGVIEFQPSSWSKGSYLNVGVCWLWYEKDHFSFDDGYRVEDFRQFRTAEQFEASAQTLACRAAEEALNLRQRFPSIETTAARLCEKETSDIWRNYHAGVSAGLIGDNTTAITRLKAVLDEKRDFLWIQELKRFTDELLSKTSDTYLFKSVVRSAVVRSRHLLKLSALPDETRFQF